MSAHEAFTHQDILPYIIQDLPPNMHALFNPPSRPPGGPSPSYLQNQSPGPLLPFLDQPSPGPQTDMSMDYARTRPQGDPRRANLANIQAFLRSQDQRNRDGPYTSLWYNDES
jgi:hypothetical protein